MNRLRSFTLCAAAWLTAGCAVGPDFRAPAPPAVLRFTAEPLAAPADAAGGPRFVSGRDIAADWWTVFQSPPLNALIDEALHASPDLQAADALLRAARENVSAQQAAFWPGVEAQLNPTRQSIAPALSSPLESGGSRYSLHTAQVSVAYAPDVFGANRRQVESLQAQADAQRCQLDAARVTLSTNLVVAVVQRASLQAQIRATRELIALASRQLDLLRRGRQLGQVGAADVAAQQAALTQAQATLPPLQKQWAQQGNLLAALTGRAASEAVLPDIELDTLLLPEELPLSLPARLVEQRPDVCAALAQWHGASAQIGVAAANRLPNLTLVAGAGSTALQLSRLLGAGTGFWSVGANLVQPVFDGGALRHRQAAAEAGNEQAAAQYRSTVLAALQNVADTLEAIQSDAAALDAMRAAERAADLSLTIARRQHQAGEIGGQAVLSAEQAHRQAIIGGIQAQATRLADSAALFQALGGGWWNRAGRVGVSGSGTEAP